MTFADRDGTYTNIERRVQLLNTALGPKGDEDADWRIICQIAKRMDAQGFDYANAESRVRRVRRAVAAIRRHIVQQAAPRDAAMALRRRRHARHARAVREILAGKQNRYVADVVHRTAGVTTTNCTRSCWHAVVC